MSRPENDEEQQKVPIGAKIGLGLLGAVCGLASRFGKNKPGKKGPTVVSFGFGEPLVTRGAGSEGRKFTFRILDAAKTERRGVAVLGMVAQGEAHTGDTVTCVTTDGWRFPCVIQEIERACPNPLSTDTARAGTGPEPPMPYTLFVSGHSPEDFRPSGKFIIETGEHDEQCL